MPAPGKTGLVMLAGSLAATAPTLAANAVVGDWPAAPAIERAREAHPFPDADRIRRVAPPALPRITPATPEMDIAAIARRHIELKGQHEASAAPEPLRIFVSLSMPQASLRLLTGQAERAQATLVLRGLKNDSMRQTLEAVQALIGEHKVNWQIDPEAFVRYGVRHAPTFVLLTGSATNTHSGACGASCNTASTFYSVAGDVSLAYALDTLARRYPAAQPAAAPFLQRLQVSP